MMLNIHKSKDGPQQATKHTSTGTRVQFYSINLPLFYMYMASLSKKKIQYIFCTSALLLIEKDYVLFPSYLIVCRYTSRGANGRTVGSL